MDELEFPYMESTILYCDNQSAIQLTNNLIAHNEMKHVELHSHYLRQVVHENVFSLVYCQRKE